MSSVWVVEAGFDYDGSEIVGIFSTFEKAKEVKERTEETLSQRGFDWVDCSEYCVID